MPSSEVSVKITAKTLKKALAEAALKLGVAQDELDHKLISKTDGGFFSFIGRRVEIEAWPLSAVAEDEEAFEERPRRKASGGRRRSRRSADSRPASSRPTRAPRHKERAPYPRAVRDETPLTPEQIKAIKDEIRTACDDICQYLIGGETYELATREENGRFTIDIYDDSLGKQVAKNAKIAESLEHILRKIPKIKRELPFRIFVDVNEIRQSRENELMEMAQDLSAQVHDNKRPIVLNYKNSYDRKIIHMALDQDDRVYTKSIGEGANRKLMILPSQGEDGDEPRTDGR